jgi:hypothetical protein
MWQHRRQVQTSAHHRPSRYRVEVSIGDPAHQPRHYPTGSIQGLVHRRLAVPTRVPRAMPLAAAMWRLVALFVLEASLVAMAQVVIRVRLAVNRLAQQRFGNIPVSMAVSFGWGRPFVLK